MPQHQDQPVTESTTEARAGVTGHNVRYVLLFGLSGAILVLAIVVYQYAI